MTSGSARSLCVVDCILFAYGFKWSAVQVVCGSSLGLAGVDCLGLASVVAWSNRARSSSILKASRFMRGVRAVAQC